VRAAIAAGPGDEPGTPLSISSGMSMRRRFEDPSVEELMTRGPITVPVGARVRDAVELLETLDVRHLPVVDGEGNLVGIVSDRDLRSASIQRLIGGRVASPGGVLDDPITSIMSSDVVSIDRQAPMSELVDLLLEHRVGALPVTDAANGDLVGIVSYVDVLRAIQS
jgi:acetoin utilization protein AcuB